MHLRASKLIEELSVIFPPPWVNHFSTPAPYSILPKLMSPWLESRPSSPSILILLYRLKRPWTTNFIQASTPSFFFSPSLPWSIDQQHHHLFIFSCRVAAVAASFFSIFMLLGSSLLLSLLCVFALREPGASVHHHLLLLAVWVAATEITITIICFVHLLLFLLWSWSLVAVAAPSHALFLLAIAVCLLHGVNQLIGFCRPAN